MDNQTTPNNPLKNYFEQAYDKPFSDAEVAEYKDRLGKFFEVLIEVDQRNQRKNNEPQTIWNTNHPD